IKGKATGGRCYVSEIASSAARRKFKDRVSRIADIDVTCLVNSQSIGCYTLSEVALSPARFVFEDTVLQWNSGKKIARLVTSQDLSRDLCRSENALLSLWSKFIDRAGVPIGDEEIA